MAERQTRDDGSVLGWGLLLSVALGVLLWGLFVLAVLDAVAVLFGG